VTIRSRVWNDLHNTTFYIEYLSLHIESIKRYNRKIEIAFLASTVFSIIGNYQFSNWKILWTILLSVIVLLRIMKPKLIKSEREVFALEKLKEFYIDHLRDLDNLWYKIYNKKILETSAELEFDKLNEEERLIIKIEKHQKLPENKVIEDRAEEITLLKLKKYLNG